MAKLMEFSFFLSQRELFASMTLSSRAALFPFQFATCLFHLIIIILEVGIMVSVTSSFTDFSQTCSVFNFNLKSPSALSHVQEPFQNVTSCYHPFPEL